MPDETPASSAERVRTLANDERFEGRKNDLSDLADDLSRQDGDRWAGVDLFSAFPPDSAVRISHRNLVELVLGALAGITVFAPVAWTWWGFHTATGAYQEMLEADEVPDGTTFLGLWATGFDGRVTGKHELVSMAGWSVVLILLAVACIVAHRVVAARNVSREESQLHDAQSQLVEALTGAQLLLNRRRADHPERIEGIIKSSMEKLHEAHSATRDAVGELSSTSQRVAVDMTNLLGAVKSAGEEAGKVVEAATAAATTLQGAALQTEQGMAALEASVRASVSHAEQTLAASAQQLAASLREALDEFETALGGHLDSFTTRAVGAVEQSGSRLGDVVGLIGTSAQQTSASAERLTDQVSVLADESAAASGDLVAAVRDVREAVADIEGAIARHDSTLQGQASELTQNRDAAERMLKLLLAASEVRNGSGQSAPIGG